MNKTWTTQDGKKLEFRWMVSDHLVHSVNMLWRKNQFDTVDWEQHRLHKDIGLLLQEVEQRGLLTWQGGPTPHHEQTQLVVPNVRETKVQLCMLRALLDVKPRSPADIIKLYREDMDRYIRIVERHAHKGDRDRDIWTLFVAYRVNHGA